MLRDLSGWHLLIIAIVVLVLFGSKKLPDAARSFGRSMRILKAETKAMREDDEPADPAGPQSRQLPPPLPPGTGATPPAPAAQPQDTLPREAPPREAAEVPRAER